MIMMIDGVKDKFYFTEISPHKYWFEFDANTVFSTSVIPRTRSKVFIVNIITLIKMSSTFDLSTFSKFWKPL